MFGYINKCMSLVCLVCMYGGHRVVHVGYLVAVFLLISEGFNNPQLFRKK